MPIIAPPSPESCREALLRQPLHNAPLDAMLTGSRRHWYIIKYVLIYSIAQVLADLIPNNHSTKEIQFYFYFILIFHSLLPSVRTFVPP